MMRDDMPDGDAPDLHGRSDLNDPSSAAQTPYTIGYGKPPLQHRFQPGHSGNKKGRPQRDRSFAANVGNQLGETIWTISNGRRRRMTKVEALIAQTVKAALGGNQRDRRTVIEWAAQYGPKSEPLPELVADIDSLNDEQLRLLASIPISTRRAGK